MDFFEVIGTRRSIRHFKGDSVPREALERIVSAGLDAPSGCNMQAKHFIIVDDKDTLARIGPICEALSEAPAAIVLAIEPRVTEFGEFWVQDASAAMENMLLAAVALGYGGCWVEGAVRRHEQELCEILAVPRHLRLWSVTPIGTPAVEPKRPPKDALRDVVHYNRFAQ